MTRFEHKHLPLREDQDPFFEPPTPESSDFEPLPKSAYGNLNSSDDSELAKKPQTFLTRITMILLLTAITFTTFEPSDVRQTGNQLLASDFFRLPLAMMAHSGLGHLLSNSLFLVIFGILLNSYTTVLFYPISTIILGLATHVLTLVIYVQQGKGDVGLIGASGMVYVMLGQWSVVYIRALGSMPQKRRVFRIIGFILALFVPSQFDPQTSYLAHGIGFILGICVSFLLPRRFIHR